MRSSKTKAFLYMLLWAVFFILAMSLNKTMDKSIPTAIIVFYRMGFASIGLLPTLLYQGKKVFKTKIIHLHLIRALLTSIAIWCTYYAYRHLPFAVATSVGLSGPLFTSALAVIFLKEELTFQKSFIILIGYVGVLFVVFPHCIDMNSISTFSVLVALFGNIITAGIIILLKRLTQTDQTETILTYNTFLVTLIYAMYASRDFYMPSGPILYILMGIGLCGLVLQFCYARAIKHAEASFVAPLEYLRIVLSIPVGYLFFNEAITTEILWGTTLIVASTYSLLRMPSKIS